MGAKSFTGTPEIQIMFVLNDKLVCTMKKKKNMVSMAIVNVILEHGAVHTKLVISLLLLIPDHFKGDIALSSYGK